MVFIVLGAVKAAKHARNEYRKDKKRNTCIAPVDGSHDMMADRAASSQSNQTGSTEWWGTCRAADAPAPTCDASSNPNLVGAWSRDAPTQQHSQEGSARPPSYASSATASTELSAPIAHSPHEDSGSLSRLDTVKRTSQRSGDAHIRPRPASIDTLSTSGHGECNVPLPVRHSSDGVQTTREAGGRKTLDLGDFSRMAVSSREDSVADTGVPTSCNEDAVPIKSMEEMHRKADAERDRAKACVQGSFAEAMQKPRAVKTRMSDSNLQASGETVSALSRNASKGLRRRTSQMDSNPRGVNSQAAQGGDGNPSAFSRNDTRDHMKRLGRRIGDAPIAEEKDGSTGSSPTSDMATQSALARNASKGPRRRLHPMTNGLATVGSAERDMVGNERQQGKQEDTRLVDAQPKNAGTGVSAFAGAPTKKRSKRVYPPKAASLNVVSNAGTADSHEVQPEPMKASSMVTGSSMYAAGSMKKRGSRR